MWPRNVIFSGLLFSRLNIYPNNVYQCTIMQLHKIALHSVIIDSWQRLEHALIDISYFLLKKKQINLSTLGVMDFPSAYGYTQSHLEEENAFHCIYNSRNAFITLATLCTFAIAINMSPNDIDASEPEWINLCHREHGINLAWLNELRSSFVCDFTPGLRPGAYINGWQSPWAAIFPSFAIMKTPLGIWWSSCTVDDPEMYQYMPSEEDQTLAKYTYLHQVPCITATSQFSS